MTSEQPFPRRSSSGGFQHVWHGIGAGLTRAGAAHDQNVGVVFVLVAVHPDAKVPRQQQVGTRLVRVLSVQGKNIAPASGTVFLAGAGVLLVGCDNDDNDRIERGAEQQKARGLRCVIDRQRLCKQIVDGRQHFRPAPRRHPTVSLARPMPTRQTAAAAARPTRGIFAANGYRSWPLRGLLQRPEMLFPHSIRFCHS